MRNREIVSHMIFDRYGDRYFVYFQPIFEYFLQNISYPELGLDYYLNGTINKEYTYYSNLIDSLTPENWALYLTNDNGKLVGTAIGTVRELEDRGGYGRIRIAELRSIDIKSKYRGLGLCKPTVMFIFSFLFETEQIDYLWLYNAAEELGCYCYVAAGLNSGLKVAISDQFNEMSPILTPEMFRNLHYLKTVDECLQLDLEDIDINITDDLMEESDLGLDTHLIFYLAR